MPASYFHELHQHAAAFARLTPERQQLLHEVSPEVRPHLDAVTDRFYGHLQKVPRTAPFLEGRLPSLRRTYRAWLEELFTADYDAFYVERIYRIGDAHVQARLPVEFMAGGMTLVANELGPLMLELAAGDGARQVALAGAVTAVLGYSLIVMQESYQVSRLLAERENFLAVTGISRDIFNRLAAARRTPSHGG